jgi:DNA-binding response OmpR family regulator
MKAHNLQKKDMVIILFENEESLRRSIYFTLLRSGYNVNAFEKAEDATGVIRTYEAAGKSVDVIIVDLHLRGAAALHYLKELVRVSAAVPILVITGYSLRDIQKDLENLGIHYLLDKPFCVDELVEKIKTIVIEHYLTDCQE